MPKALGLCRVTLRVRDLRAMEGFYAGLLGFTVAWRPDGDTLVLTLGQAALVLCREELIAARGALRALSVAYRGASDIEAACHVLEAAQVRILEAPAQQPDGAYRALVADPEGNAVELRSEP